MDAKSKEAYELFTVAEKAYFIIAETRYAKKSLFGKPKPDYDTAAQYYDQAALGFKNVKNYERAMDAYARAGQSHAGNNSYYHYP
jgi:hypothetical protein